MPNLVFKIGKAGEHGKSPIEIILIDETRRRQSKQAGPSIVRETTDNTDNLLSTLDKVLKSAKLKIESIKNIKVISHKEAGLTSQRIVKAIKQALDF